jgi:hypothetical protein
LDNKIVSYDNNEEDDNWEKYSDYDSNEESTKPENINTLEQKPIRQRQIKPDGYRKEKYFSFIID